MYGPHSVYLRNKIWIWTRDLKLKNELAKSILDMSCWGFWKYTRVGNILCRHHQWCLHPSHWTLLNANCSEGSQPSRKGVWLLNWFHYPSSNCCCRAQTHGNTCFNFKLGSQICRQLCKFNRLLFVAKLFSQVMTDLACRNHSDILIGQSIRGGALVCYRTNFDHCWVPAASLGPSSFCCIWCSQCQFLDSCIFMWSIPPSASLCWKIGSWQRFENVMHNFFNELTWRSWIALARWAQQPIALTWILTTFQCLFLWQ